MRNSRTTSSTPRTRPRSSSRRTTRPRKTQTPSPRKRSPKNDPRKIKGSRKDEGENEKDKNLKSKVEWVRGLFKFTEKQSKNKTTKHQVGKITNKESFKNGQINDNYIEIGYAQSSEDRNRIGPECQEEATIYSKSVFQHHTNIMLKRDKLETREKIRKQIRVAACQTYPVYTENSDLDMFDMFCYCEKVRKAENSYAIVKKNLVMELLTAKTLEKQFLAETTHREIVFERLLRFSVERCFEFQKVLVEKKEEIRKLNHRIEQYHRDKCLVFKCMTCKEI